MPGAGDILSAGSGLGAGYGAAAGYIGGRGDRAAARRARERALAELYGVNAEATRSGASGQALTNNLGAMQALRALYDEGGMDAGARSALAQAQESSAANERMQRMAIGQNMQARGLGSGGTQLAAQLAAQQGGANRNAMAGTQAAADARSRAIQGLTGSAQVGQGIKAGEDAFEQFNARQRLSRAGMLSDAQNAEASARQKEDEDRRRAAAGLGSISPVGGIIGGLL